MSFVCLYFGNPEECQSCGGWLKAEGGPFPGDSRYCSRDCFEDAREREAQRAARLKCCDECGYDNAEHDPSCPAAPISLP
jgi:hypothetical protein